MPQPPHSLALGGPLAILLALATPFALLHWYPVPAGATAPAPAAATIAAPPAVPAPRPTQEPDGLSSRPLHPPRAGDGPRFRSLPSSATGLTFTNELLPANRFTYLTNGAGLAVGDYDGDGLPDLYLVSQDGPDQLFRQDAPLHFVDVTKSAGNIDGGAGWGTGATFADVDGDGRLDLYVCRMEAKNLLYRNRGDGTFEECAARFGLDLGAASTMAAFCDYDRDGDLDVHLLTNRALHAGWALTPEVLDGFRPPADTLRSPRAMVPTLDDLRDPLVQRLLRGDGDLATTDAVMPARLREHYFVFRGRLYMAGQPDHLLRNDHGHFVDVTADAHMHDHGMGLSASWWDYDQDGWPDLYVANDLETPDTLWHNERDGTFRDVTAATLPHTAYYGMGSDSGDIDGDGRLDFFVGDMSATTHRMAKILMGDMTAQRDFLSHGQPQQYMRNALYLNTGTGRFREGALLAGVASTDWTWSTLFGDLDGDGRLDLFCTNGIARFDMNPDLILATQALWQQGRTDEAIARIKGVPSVAEKNVALRNIGDLQFRSTGAEWGLDWSGISHGAVLCDLDRDGDLDVVTNNFDAAVTLFENTTTDAHAVAVVLRGAGQNPFGIGARVELTTSQGLQVRENWLARGYLSGQEPRVCFGLGATTAIRKLVVRWPSGSVQEFADLAADREYTVREAVAQASPTSPSAPMPTGAPTTAAPPDAATPTSPSPDALVAPAVPAVTNAAAAPPWFALATNGPQFRHRERPFDDFKDQFLLPHKLSQLGPGLAVGDADGDGDDDLYVGGAAGQAGALLRNDHGQFVAVAGPWDADAECEDLGALWLDGDADGDLDLFVASGGVEAPAGDPRLRDRYYRNDGALHFTRDDQALPDLRDSSSCCCAGDYDGDGDLDLFVGSRTVPGRFPDAPSSHLLRNDGGRFTEVTAAVAPALATAGMVTGALFLGISGDDYPDLLIAAQWQPVRYLRNEDGAHFVDATAAAGLADCTGLWNSLAALDADDDGDTDFIAGNLGRNTKYKATAEHPLGLVCADFDGNGTRDLVETKYEGDRLLPVRGRSCSSQAMPFLAQKFPTYEQFASSVLQDIYPADQLAQATHLSASCLDSMLLRNDGDGHFTLQPLPRDAQIAPLFGFATADFDGDHRDDLVAATNFFSPEPETGHFDGGLGLLLRGADPDLAAVPPRTAGIAAFADQKGAVVLDADGDGRPDVVIAANDGPLMTFANASAGAMLAVRLRGGPGNPTGVGAVVGVQREDGSSEHRTVLAGAGYLSQSSACTWFARRGAPIQSVLVVWPGGLVTRIDRDLERAVIEVAIR